MEKHYSNLFVAHYAKSNKRSSVIVKLKWNMKLLYFAENVFCKYSLKQRRSEVKQENWTQRGWHWITLLPGSGRRFGGGREGQRLRFWPPAWHMHACYDPIMGTLLSQPKIRLPHPQDNLSLNPSPKNSAVHQNLCSDRIPYPSCLWGQPLATCAFEPLNFG